MNYKIIKVAEKTHSELVELSVHKETFDETIKRLIKFYKRK